MEIFRHFFKFKKPWVAILALGLLSIFLSNIATFFISPLIISIILGALIANFLPKSADIFKQTLVVNFASKEILRLGIVLFGFRISLADIQFVGFSGVGLAIFIVFSTFFIGIFVGKALGLDYKFSALISSGSAVCGAAAVMATQSVLNENSNRVAIAICYVVVFGTFGMILCPLLFDFFDFNHNQMGAFIGSSLHEVAHVIAASVSLGDDTAKSAVIIKMLRVLMLIPLLLMLVFLNFNKNVKATKHFPVFAFVFLFVVAINSVLNLPQNIIDYINYLDTLLLSIAMVALGLGIHKNIFKNVGLKPFALSFVLFLYLMVSCFLIVKFIM